MTQRLHGVMTALATPFDADGAVDVPTLRALVDRSVDGGVHSVLTCGSTAEFTAMSSGERRLILETVVDQVAGRVPVVAQTGALSTAEAIELSCHAQAAGADVIMPVAPFYEPLTMAQTLTYLRTVSASVELPVMLYNLPSATGVELDVDTIGALAREVDNIRYVKNTMTDMAHTARLIHEHGDVIGTFVGWDSLILSALAEGAAGVVAGTANIVPAQLVAVYDAVVAGDLPRARVLWEPLYPLLETMLSGPFTSAVKAGLETVGLRVGLPREPLTPLEPQAAERIRLLLAGL